MKVLFHCSEYPPESAGVGNYVRNMAQALSTTGHQAAVLTCRSESLPEESVEEGVTVLRKYDFVEKGTARVRDMAISMAKEFKADVIEGADHLGDCASILRTKHVIPVVIKVHACQVVKVLQDAMAYYPWQHLTMAIARLRAYGQMRNEEYSIKHADILVSPTKRMMEELVKQGLVLPARRGIVPNPIIIPSGDVYTESASPTILFVGRLEFLKGIQFLPDIMKKVLKEFPETVLEIAGADSYARWVGSMRQWLTDRLGDKINSVKFLGKLNPKQLDQAYARSWVVIHPSLWDNFPTVVLEAMAKVKPIVTSPHGGMPEMLADTRSPIEDPSSPSFGEAVCRLLRDQQERERLGQANFRKVQDYSPEKVIPQYLDFLKANL